VFDAILVGTATYHHGMLGKMKNYFEESAVRNMVRAMER
jgi:NAD(P)H-dependent FMN reductase